MPELPTELLLFSVLPLLAGLWVFYDGATRLPGRPTWERYLWVGGTVLALPVFLPMYLIGGRSPDRSGSWGPAEMIAIAIFFGLTLPVVVNLLKVRPEALTLMQVSWIILVQNLGFVLLPIFGIAVRYRLPLARLGLTLRRWPRYLLAGVAVGLLTVPLSMGTEWIAVKIDAAVEGQQAAEVRAEAEHQSDPLGRMLEANRGRPGAYWLLFLLAVVVPVGEETYFRGVVFGGLRNRYGLGWALAGNTLLFGGVHRQIIHFLPIAALALIFALLYERTKSLLPAIAVHAVNNVVAVLAQLYDWNI